MTDIKLEDSVNGWHGSSTQRAVISTSDTTTYLIYAHGIPREVSYKKTTDGGSNWSARASVEAMRGGFDIWYARWLAPAASNIVYLAWGSHLSESVIRFCTFNVDTETFSTPVNVGTVAATSSFVDQVSITRARNGDLYVTGRGSQSTLSPDGATFRSTDGGATWSEVADLTEAQEDQIMLFPDYSSADTADICALFWDYSASQISIKQYDQSADTITETVIASAMQGYTETDSIGQYDTHNWAASLNSSGHIYLAAVNNQIVEPDEDPTGLSATMTTYDVFGSSVTAKGTVLSSVAYASTPSLSIDSSGTVTCFYARSLTSDPSEQAIFYKQSTDSMATWGSEVQISSGDNYAAALIYTDLRPAGVFLPVWLALAMENDLYSLDNPVPVTSYTPTATPPLVFECKEVDGVYAVSVVVDGPAVVKCKVVDGVSVLSATVDAFTLPRSFT